jgi:YVTN family beta-propeller protein
LRRFVIYAVVFASALHTTVSMAQQVIATVPVGVMPVAVALNALTNQTYVGDRGGASVTVIDGTTNQTTPITVGALPEVIDINPVTNKIYVASEDSTLTVIDGATHNTQSIPIGFVPTSVAVNPITNKIYVVNLCGNSQACAGDGTVTVIDGVTNQTSTVTVGWSPIGVAVNPVTNKIYVANQCGDPLCDGPDTVTVIDGATNGTTTINGGSDNIYVAVNPVTNKVYVTDETGNEVLVIDGTTNQLSTISVGSQPYGIVVNPVTNHIYVGNLSDNTVSDIDGTSGTSVPVPVGQQPWGLGVDSITDKIYVTNRLGNTVTMIDGTNDHTATVNVGTDPRNVAVNPITNRIYVTNRQDNTVSVIAGAEANPLQFVPLTPCRLVDTRNTGGPIQGGTAQSFPLPQRGGCNVPTTAAAFSLNVTVVPIGSLGYLTIWPTGESQPFVSTMNSLDGRIKANAAVVPAGASGAVSVYASSTTNVVLDIDGYFIPTSGSTLAFYPLPPCRVLDTRHPHGDLGGPYLQGGQERDFPILESSCNIPSSAQAYSLNFTVVPYNGQSLGYLTVWPTGESKPVVSTLNNLTGTVVANAAIVPAGTGGEIAVFPSDNTQLAADIDGYFAPAGAGGLSLYPKAPCRVIDTRRVGNGQPFTGTLNPPVDVADSACALPSVAQAYAFNATVVPAGVLGYLTLWPDGEGQPVVSTLNAIDGAITSNMAIVPTANGKIDAYAAGLTQLILDISSYFAP